MELTGILYKMPVALADPVKYQLALGDHLVELNSRIGKPLTFAFTGNIFCIRCHRKTNKSFQQGYCFPCYRELLHHNLCVIHPERCRFKGECPKDHWVSKEHGGTHIVYLANTSGLKVGITRESQIPTRWIDQGAIQALPIIQIANRYLAGIVEVELKKHFHDKTNWRAMLKGEVVPVDLTTFRDQVFQTLKLNDLEIIHLAKAKPVMIHYPVEQFPAKITSLNFDKTPIVSGRLLGMKGQYLIFDSGVINLRKFGGYEVKFTAVSKNIKL